MLRSYGTISRYVRTLYPVWRIQPLSTSSNVSEAKKPVPRLDENASQEASIARRRGRPRKETVEATHAEEKSKNTQTSTSKAAPNKPNENVSLPAPKRKRTHKSTPTALPARLVQPSSNHNDLCSFLAYAARTNLNESTNVYKGTHYEYTVASALKPFNFTLHRTGRSNDLGIDLVGHVELPNTTRRPKSEAHDLRVLVQCKAVKPTPSMVRELEGAYVGAPAGWRGEGVLALLVASKEATKGVRDALQRSRWPMGLVQVTAGGEVRQLLWNLVAAQIGLEGLGVTVRYAERSPNETDDDGNELVFKERSVKSSIALTWMGKPWRPATSSQ